MKNLFSVCLFFLFTTIVFPQAGSVELRDGGGTLISTHASIAEAYNAIPTPLTQSYLIEILSTYDQSSETIPITLTAKNGASFSNTITIRPALGNSGEVISATSTAGIVVLNDADYLIIDGRPGGFGNTPDLRIANLATTGTNSSTIWLQNGASNNVVKYVHIVNNTQNTAGPRAVVIGTSTTTGNSNNLITNCKIEGGRSGVGVAGSTTVPNYNNRVSQCEIFNWGYAGIWLVSGAMNFTADSNRIYQTVGVNNTIVSGIIMTTMAGATYNLKKNWIYDLQTTSISSSNIRGIYAAGPAAGTIFNIENNMISNVLDNLNAQNVTGIELLGSNAYTANIYYNTVKIGGNHTGGTAGATTSAGIRIGAAAITLNMKNNIAINQRTGGNVNHIGFVLFNNTGTYDMDYNCYYADGTNSFQAYVGTTGYNNLTVYKTASNPNEQNTIFKNVSFVSATDLHVVPPSDGDPDLAGITITGIIDDFDGDLRDTQFPYKGADEGTTIPVELTSFSALVNGNNVVLTWSTATETNNVGFSVERKSDYTEWTNIGFVNGSGTSVNTNNYIFIDEELPAGIYNYRIKQTDYNGTFKYYYLAETVEIGLPQEFRLFQNYPNPFNPSTKISWQTPVAARNTVKVFDLLGNEIATLIDEQKEAGRYEIIFDSKDLSSGIYLIQLKAGEFISTKKMTLLR
ncbi:T9SS type A sorting domain-containing protein [Ignavibacterium sp.]|uniref:T9SS type A sorting domain-containing protein n=1 Tax=Ignavibacterium sp. TaxID=2651167 RepID=UPI00307E999A